MNYSIKNRLKEILSNKPDLTKDGMTNEILFEFWGLKYPKNLVCAETVLRELRNFTEAEWQEARRKYYEKGGLFK